MTSDSSKNGTPLLDGIHGPNDIKAIREQDLPQLAQEVRDKLIQVLSQTGGHLGPNLGVVEITIAAHRKRTRLLRRGPRRHGVVGRTGDGGGARPARGG